MQIQGVVITTTDYKGRSFDRFYASKDDPRPGWFVKGCNEGYGNRLRMVCARPDRPARMFPKRNCKMFGGWRTKREAEDIARRMNLEMQYGSLADVLHKVGQ